MPRLPLFALKALSLTSLIVSSCAVYPARFADAKAIVAVADDAPIAQPRKLEPLDALYVTDVFIRRPIVSTLEPERIPDAGDVNALDEVPRSSFYDPEGKRGTTDGPPVLPLHAQPEEPVSGLGGLSVIDARGVRYELRRDPAGRPELTTAASAVASRLLRAVGYRTADVWVLDLRYGDLLDASPGTSTTGRIAAVRWPIGIDVGATPTSEARSDDPNDRVPHPDRRTLRALKTALYWVGMRRLWPGSLRDAYVGEPGRGHLLHYIVGMEDALGADKVTHPESVLEGESALRAFLTLGLLVKTPPLVQTRWPSLGTFEPDIDPRDFGTGPPYEPLDRALPADVYWMAKRIAAVPPEVLGEALSGAQMHDGPSRARLVEVLSERRRRLLEDAFGQVSPCEVVGVEKGVLTLHDEGFVGAGAGARSGESRYAVSVLDSEGGVLSGPARIAGEGGNKGIVRVSLPEGSAEYLVVRVGVERRGKPAPRAMEVHVVRRGGGIRVVGVRH